MICYQGEFTAIEIGVELFHTKYTGKCFLLNLVFGQSLKCADGHLQIHLRSRCHLSIQSLQEFLTASRLSIARWKIPGADEIPKGRWLKWNNPL